MNHDATLDIILDGLEEKGIPHELPPFLLRMPQLGHVLPIVEESNYELSSLYKRDLDVWLLHLGLTHSTETMETMFGTRYGECSH